MYDIVHYHGRIEHGYDAWGHALDEIERCYEIAAVEAVPESRVTWYPCGHRVTTLWWHCRDHRGEIVAALIHVVSDDHPSPRGVYQRVSGERD